MRFFLISILLVSIFASCNNQPKKKQEVINGVSVVALSRPSDHTWTEPIQQLNANWVTLMPFAFSQVGQPDIYFDRERQWWGETSEGVRVNIQQAHTAGFKVMLKPHVWLRGQWIGDFTLENEADWQIWEQNYRDYILNFAKIAEEEKVDLLCIGTEMRQIVRDRPAFWKSLIPDIRQAYNGKLTYCSNWDDYTEVPFWEQLDFVGISAYFPLSETAIPNADELIRQWQPIKTTLQDFSSKMDKPILFTEYGYRSIEQVAWRSWEVERLKLNPNFEAQQIAYKALFDSFWAEPWFAGGFLWKWYPNHEKAGGMENSDWTPQNKTAEQVIREVYGSF
jgi:hypothetical protein